MEELIKDKVRRKKAEYKRNTIILAILTGVFLTLVSTYEHPLAFTPWWYVFIAVALVIVFFLYFVFYAFIVTMLENNVRNELVTAFVTKVMDVTEKLEVKNKEEKTCELIYDLQKRGKFYASFLNEEKLLVHIVYKYEGENKYISYECLNPLEFYNKYTIIEM